MERWSPKQWRAHMETCPESAELDALFQRATRLLQQVGAGADEVFGGRLDRKRALRTLDTRAPIRPDEPKAIRKLRAELLTSLLLSIPGHLDAATHRALIREAADTVRVGDRDRANELRDLVSRLCTPRREPPRFTIPDHEVEREAPQPSAPDEAEPSPVVIRWEIGVPTSSQVRVTLHDSSGTLIQPLFDGVLAAGMHDCEAEVARDIAARVGPLGYLRMELPGGRWHQSVYVPED